MINLKKLSSESAPLNKKERLNWILSKFRKIRFLEIGVGPNVLYDRHKLLVNNKIEYVGMDFDDVCETHRTNLENMGINLSKHKYIGNSRKGSYLFNLIHLLEANERFDIIFFDGHHTLNVDTAPMIVASLLLKPSGYFIADDYSWSLANAQSDIERSEFYKTMYDFDIYTETEKKVPHVKVICDVILPHVQSLELNTNMSLPNWKVYNRNNA